MSEGLETAGKYQAYSKYTEMSDDCWFGRAPSHWQIKRISYVAILKSGDAIVSEQIEAEGDYPVYGGNGHRGYTKNFNHDGSYILIGRQGALCGNVNYGFGRFWASEHAVIVYPSLEVDLKWLGETLRAMDLNQYNVSAAQPGLAISNITCLKIPFPNIEEQQNIANFLDHETAKIDTLIEKQQQLIKLLKEKRQAVISHAVTKGLNPDVSMRDSGVEWLGEVPEKWEVYKLKHACSEIFLGLTSKVDYVEAGGVPLVRALNISGGILDLSLAKEISVKQHKKLTRYRCAARDDVLLSKSGTIGTAAIVDTDIEFSIYESIFALRATEIIMLPEYLLFYIQSSVAKAQYARDSVGMGVHHLNMPDIQEVKIPIPPIEEQNLILNKLRQELIKFDRLIAKAGNSIGLIKERRIALISAAVTGKIDVRNWQAPKDKTV